MEANRAQHHRRTSSALPLQVGQDTRCNNQGCCFGCCGFYTIVVFSVFLFYMIPQGMWWAECKDHASDVDNTVFSCGSYSAYLCFGIFPATLLFSIGCWIAMRWYNTRQTIFKPISSKRGICIGWTIGMLIPILLAPNVYWWADIHQDLDQCREFAVNPPQADGWCNRLRALDSILITAAVVEIPWGVILIGLVYGIVSHRIQNPLVKVHKLTSWKTGDKVIVRKEGYDPVGAIIKFEGEHKATWKIGVELESPRPYSQGEQFGNVFDHKPDCGFMMSFREAEFELHPDEYEDSEDDPHQGRALLPGGSNKGIAVGADSSSEPSDDGRGGGLPAPPYYDQGLPPPPPSNYADPQGGRPKILPNRALYENIVSSDNNGILRNAGEGWYVEIAAWAGERDRRWIDLLHEDYSGELWAQEAATRAEHWAKIYGPHGPNWREPVIEWIVDDEEKPYVWLGHPKPGINREKLVEGLPVTINVEEIRRDPAILADVPGEYVKYYGNDEELRWYFVEAIHVVVNFGAEFHPARTIPFTEEKPVVVAGYLGVVLEESKVTRRQGVVGKEDLPHMWNPDDANDRAVVSGHSSGYGGGQRIQRDV